jgi:hypothetical protein
MHSKRYIGFLKKIIELIAKGKLPNTEIAYHIDSAWNSLGGDKTNFHGLIATSSGLKEVTGYRDYGLSTDYDTWDNDRSERYIPSDKIEESIDKFKSGFGIEKCRTCHELENLIKEQDLVKKYRPCEEPRPLINNATGLDFGVSAFSHNAPNYPIERNLIFVPHKGKLRPMNEYIDDCIKDAAACKTSVNNNPAVNFRGPPRSYDITYIYLVWINERNEWVGIEENSWLESDAWGSDNTYTPPKALNEKYGKKILEAYKIAEPKISCKDVLRVHPSKLEEMYER